jgi:TolB-like protein/DNA-binding SARP family transcriptional activator
MARRALTLDPLREDAHRQITASLAALGQRTSALRQYELIRRLLAVELGVLPEAATTTLYDAIARGEICAKMDEVVSDTTHKAPGERPLRGNFIELFGRRNLKAAWVPLALVLTIVGGAVAWYERPAKSVDQIPSIAVLPFTSDGKHSSEPDAIETDLSSLLSTHPGLRVVSSSPISTEAVAAPAALSTARYALQGSVRHSARKLQVSVRLIDGVHGDNLWADLLEMEGDDFPALKQQIAYRIYESLVGFTGQIERNEQRLAWSKPVSELSEYDYARRGEQLAFQFQKAPQEKARDIWYEGLRKFPNSVRLRFSLAALYRYWAEVGWSNQPDLDLAKAWRLGREASLMPTTSRFEQWLSHWLMAKLAQWCDQDFERSVAEARYAMKLLPYDATARADLAELMANAGYPSTAIEWLQESIRTDPTGPEWYRGNLAWAYYLAGRHREAVSELERLNKPRPLLLAANYVRLGRVEEARALMVDYLKHNPDFSTKTIVRWPLINALRNRWLADLHQAGLPQQ